SQFGVVTTSACLGKAIEMSAARRTNAGVRWAAMKAGQSSGLVIFCTIFKPGFGWRCQAMRYR
ncbi:hypothetical protein, partial [Pseudomonas aeruginosa]|uniref:hypothetical protein n=1 Tax=Pseudomonas aeruginosa TaxID=287 RepID=UPI001F4545F6